MSGSKFVYVTYIRTTPEKLWEALTDNAFIKLYWSGCQQRCDWKKGSPWAALSPKGDVWDSGEIVEIDPPKRLVLTWRHEHMPGFQDDPTRLTYEIEQQAGKVKFTLTHESEIAESKLIGGVSEGWPHILASLKSLLETGEALEDTEEWPE